MSEPIQGNGTVITIKAHLVQMGETSMILRDAAGTQFTVPIHPGAQHKDINPANQLWCLGDQWLCPKTS